MGMNCIKNLHDYAGLCFINYRTVEALVCTNYISSINPPKTRIDRYILTKMSHAERGLCPAPCPPVNLPNHAVITLSSGLYIGLTCAL